MKAEHILLARKNRQRKAYDDQERKRKYEGKAEAQEYVVYHAGHIIS